MREGEREAKMRIREKEREEKKYEGRERGG